MRQGAAEERREAHLVGERVVQAALLGHHEERVAEDERHADDEEGRGDDRVEEELRVLHLQSSGNQVAIK